MGRTEERAQEAFERGAAVAGWSRTGACAIQTCDEPSLYFGLCDRHYGDAEEGRLPRPPGKVARGRCAIRGHATPTAENSLYCAEHLAFFRSLAGGAKLRESASRLDGYRAQSIPIDAVEPNPRRMHLERDAASLRTLAASMSLHGQIHELLVRRSGERRFQVISGDRRLAAARLISGKKTLRAIVLPASTTDEEALALAADENFERNLVGPFEKAMWIAEHVAGGLTQKQVAAAIGMEEGHVGDLLRVLQRAHDRVLREMRAGTISLNNALRIMTLPLDAQPAALARVLSARSDRKKAGEVAARTVADWRELQFQGWFRTHPGVEIQGGKRRGRMKICFEVEGIEGLRRFYWRFVRRRNR